MSKQSERGTAWETMRLRVLERDGWQCSYCGRPIEGSDATADHVTPLDKGGVSEDWNLVAACRKCNGTKSNKVLARVSWFNPSWLPGGIPS
ncbi:MAG: HNH endonuclease [Cryobacterium sp.]|nr:HNH endonuclease [Cryobacterium sp.]